MSLDLSPTTTKKLLFFSCTPFLMSAWMRESLCFHSQHSGLAYHTDIRLTQLCAPSLLDFPQANRFESRLAHMRSRLEVGLVQKSKILAVGNFLPGGEQGETLRVGVSPTDYLTEISPVAHLDRLSSSTTSSTLMFGLGFGLVFNSDMEIWSYTIQFVRVYNHERTKAMGSPFSITLA